MKKYLLICICLISVYCKLEMVIEIYRHGAREPIFDYWNAPSFKLPGELTSVGMRQHFILGAELRKEYIENQEFLSSFYDPREIYVRSSDYNRTIMSALSQLSGLYPIGTGPKVSNDISYEHTLPPYTKIDYNITAFNDFSIMGGVQVIPVHTVPDTEDRVLLGEHSDICPINKKWFDEQKNSELYIEIYKEFENNTIATLKKALNLTGNIDLGTISGINDVFLNDIFANKPLPDLLDDVFKNMTYIYTMNLLYTYFGGVNQRKFIPTPLFTEILGHFENKILNKTSKKWVMYSAHDSTLGYVYTLLNISSYECHLQLWKTNKTDSMNCAGYPLYASNVLIELHSGEDNGYIVKIKVNGEYYNICERNQKTCDWKEFSQRIKNVMVKNYGELCKGEQEKHKTKDEFLEIIEEMGDNGSMIAGFLAGLLIAALLVLLVLKRN